MRKMLVWRKLREYDIVSHQVTEKSVWDIKGRYVKYY